MEGRVSMELMEARVRGRKVLLKMAVCMLMGLALGEDIGNAEEGRTTHCHQKVQAVVSMDAVFC